MMRFTHTLAALVAISCLLSGCASPQKVVASGAPISKDRGYVGGLFVQKVVADVTGFTLTNVDTKQEFEIPFVSGVEKFKSVPREQKWVIETIVIDIPPGKYAVTHWFQYQISTNARNIRHEFSAAVKQKTFIVEPGKMMFLGKFAGDQVTLEQNVFQVTKYEQSTHALPISNNEARGVVNKVYPELNSLKFECLNCAP
ncbi:hypothetical protein GTP46_04625 [Duganella sp. FT135W]|uniref:DUF2846 domain-containing protein n=1 Tax=Duganella flavida TaxID=2692175 RepID=A0A6L8K4T6_9BURK|nr:hypothetical protein [Duganella flavida]MYM21935.1 hypothetical protein [Duganella flavida]